MLSGLLSLERKYDPERAKASEIAAKRKRLAQIEQRIEEPDINDGKHCYMYM